MQKWLIVSDSHGLTDELIALFERYKGYTIFHCGDLCISQSYIERFNVNLVRGNCDFSNAPQEIVDDFDFKKVFICHGHKYSVKMTLMNLFYKAVEYNVNYVFFGHTHDRCHFIEEGIEFINPGSYKDDRSYVLIEDGKVSFKKG